MLFYFFAVKVDPKANLVLLFDNVETAFDAHVVQQADEAQEEPFGLRRRRCGRSLIDLDMEVSVRYVSEDAIDDLQLFPRLLTHYELKNSEVQIKWSLINCLSAQLLDRLLDCWTFKKANNSLRDARIPILITYEIVSLM